MVDLRHSWFLSKFLLDFIVTFRPAFRLLGVDGFSTDLFVYTLGLFLER